MRHSIIVRALVVLASLVAVSGCSGFFRPPTDPPASLPEEAQDFVVRMNEHRVSQGLAPLEWHPGIADVALAHSEDMRDRSFFDHTNPDGESPFDRLAAAGITYQTAGENVARGFTNGSAVFDGWINSDGHRANIENASFTHHGLGYVEDGHYWTHVFAGEPSGTQ